MKVLRIALGEAERLELVPRNVARLARAPVSQLDRPEPFSHGEVVSILATVRGDRL